MSKEKEVKTDSEKLEMLADWFDMTQPNKKGNEVQQDLRRIAKLLAPVEAEQGEKPDFEIFIEQKKYTIREGMLVDDYLDLDDVRLYFSALQAELSAVKEHNENLIAIDDNRLNQVSSLTKELEQVSKLLIYNKDKFAELYESIEVERVNFFRENSELKEERDALKIELSNYAYQIDTAKRERDKALTERDELNKALTDIRMDIRNRKI